MKLLYRLLKPKEYKILNKVKKRLDLNKSDLESLRKERFIALLDYAKKYSPYYKKILNNIKVDSISEINIIPILTKEIIKSEFDNIKSTKDLMFYKLNSTSGSTGEATKFGTDLRDERYAYAVRGNEMTDSYNHLDKMLVFWGADRDILNKKSLRYYFNFHVKGTKVLSTYHLTDKDIKDYIRYINRFKPKIIVGYSSALTELADRILKGKNILKYKPLAIISAGEMLYEEQRVIIERGFETEIFNRYGCREFGHIANECVAHNGLHYNADRFIVEVLDDNDNPCPQGDVGNLVITDLNNFVFPLIRYKIGDLGSLSKNEDCDCGIQMPKIKKIIGRSLDIVYGTNGNKVSGSFWTLTFRYKVKGVEQFQIIQEKDKSLVINIKSTNQFNFSEEELAKEVIKEKLGEDLNVKFVKDADFVYTKTGKFKWIISYYKG